MERHKGKFASKVLRKKSKFLQNLNVCERLGNYKYVPERRIVDLRFFAEKFDDGCSKCKERFLFKDIVDEKIKGLCSLVVFQCSTCGNETKIATSRASRETKTNFKKSPYAVNLRAAIGMIHAGIGETHVNGFLGTLGIPPIHHKTLKKMERKVGKVIESSARVSCARACQEEKSATIACTTPTTVTECGDGHTTTTDEFSFAPNAARDNDFSAMHSADDINLQNSNIVIETDANHHDSDQINFDEAMDLLEDYVNVSESTSNETQTMFPLDDFEPVEEFTSSLTKESGENMMEMETLPKDVEIIVSQDAAWTKRGRGMNSLSGWGHVIGVKTKKCLDYSTRVKNCAKCNYYSRTGKNVQPHDCRKNWSGSAKSMEPDIATDLHHKAKESGLKFVGVIGDEDSSSIKHIREKVNSEITKYSDFGHLKRTLRQKLEKLQKQHKSLTSKTTDSFLKNFSYAVKQNRSATEEEMKKSLSAIIPHMYGNHLACGKWCLNMGSTSTTEKHANLAKGKDLTDQGLRLDLENLLTPFISNSGKLMTTGSTQTNESLNSVAWSKAPKIRNYNASESFDIRCSAGVTQFNDGISYVNTVIENNYLSPQKMTSKYTYSKDKQRNYQKCYKRERHVKRRRFELKRKRLFVNTSSEIKEGITYESGCLLKNEDINTERIPDALEFSQANEYVVGGNYIFYDIETTSLGNEAEIVQISACSSDSSSFNRFVVPDGSITTQASAVNGLTLSVRNGQKVICKDGKTLPGISIGTALKDFIEWIRLLNNEKNILVAHNGNNFDMRILINSCIKTGILNDFSEQVYGFVDTLPIYRSITKKGLSVSLVNIYEREFDCKYYAHDSREDTCALMRLFYHHNLEQKAASSVMKLEFALNYLRNVGIVQQNRRELEVKLCSENKVISKYLARKIANTGLSYHHLQLAYARDCVNGLRYVLAEKINTKPRVTEKKSIIKTINTYFETMKLTE